MNIQISKQLVGNIHTKLEVYTIVKMVFKLIVITEVLSPH